MAMVGRARELDALKRYYRSARPEFVVVYGRRRVGKTFLIRECFRNEFFFYSTGVSRAEVKEHAADENGTLLRLNLERFDAALSEYGMSVRTPSRSWMEAFDRLKEGIKAAGAGFRKVIFLDEMPWMDTQRSMFLTALEHFWNAFASAREDVMLIGCGSAASWMTKKVLMNKGGLYNRVTGMLKLKPFTLSECEAYFKANDIVINRRDIAEAYMIFGGIPFYYQFWDGRFSLPQNVDSILFLDGAPLRQEYDRLFASLFGTSEMYPKTVGALGDKRRGLTRSELAEALGQGDGGTLTAVLRDLELSGFIRHYSIYPGKANGGLYQLIDNFSLFHAAFAAKIKSGRAHYWSDLTETPKLNAWRGYAFEQLCLLHVDQIKAALGIAGVGADVYSWRSKQVTPGAQIDLVIDRRDRVVNLCEIKFSKYEYEITKAYSEALQNKVLAFEQETRTRSTTHLTMITTYGLRQNAYAKTAQSEVLLDDLFKDAN